MMKKAICIFASFIVIFFMGAKQVCAQSGMLYDGYTKEGVYYQVFEFNNDISICEAGKTLTVSRQIIYSKEIVPPRTIECRQGDYAGELNLYMFYYENGQTHAYYSGTLTLQK